MKRKVYRKFNGTISFGANQGIGVDDVHVFQFGSRRSVLFKHRQPELVGAVHQQAVLSLDTFKLIERQSFDFLDHGPLFCFVPPICLSNARHIGLALQRDLVFRVSAPLDHSCKVNALRVGTFLQVPVEKRASDVFAADQSVVAGKAMIDIYLKDLVGSVKFPQRDGKAHFPQLAVDRIADPSAAGVIDLGNKEFRDLLGYGRCAARF